MQQKIDKQIEFETAWNHVVSPEDTANLLVQEAVEASELAESLESDVYASIYASLGYDVDVIAEGLYEAIVAFGDSTITHIIVNHLGVVVKAGGVTPSHAVKILMRAFDTESVVEGATLVELLNGVIYDAIEEVAEDGSHLGAILRTEYVIKQHTKMVYGKTPLPLTVEPQPYNVFGCGGYFTKELQLRSQKRNSCENETDCTSLNHLARTKWIIRHDLYNEWDYSQFLYSKALEKYVEPTHSEKQQILAIAQQIASRATARIGCFDEGEVIYFVWQRDSRGRFYSVGDLLNPQGDSYMRGILQPVVE